MYLKRSLSESLITFKTLRFPYKRREKSSRRYSVTVGIGGNIGDVKRRFEHLFVALKRDKRIDIVETSLILKNPPFGYSEQEDFFNSIIVLKVNMSPMAFLAYLMRLEKKFRRTRSFANAPRSLDLDIIFFKDVVMNSEKLTIPHAHWAQRESVIIPLKSISKGVLR
jgi:2-amino-4-hydroxy-6-hydroxymethyldihydropteridine diphosphokinase